MLMTIAVGSALQMAANGSDSSNETEGGTLGSKQDGTVTRAFIRVVQAADDNFERITSEIEKEKGFKSMSLMEAEDKLLKAFVHKENSLQEQRNILRFGGKGGPEREEQGEDVENDEEQDEDDDEEEEEDEEDELEEEMDDELAVDASPTSEGGKQPVVLSLLSQGQQFPVNTLQPRRKP